MRQQKGEDSPNMTPPLARMQRLDTGASLMSVCNSSPGRSSAYSNEELRDESEQKRSQAPQKSNKYKEHADKKRQAEEQEQIRLAQEQKEYNQKLQVLRQSVVLKPFEPRRAMSSLSNRRIPDMMTLCRRAQSQNVSMRTQDNSMMVSPTRSVMTDVSLVQLSPKSSLPNFNLSKQSTSRHSRLQQGLLTPKSDTEMRALRASRLGRSQTSLSPSENMTAEETKKIDAALKLRESGFCLRTWEKSYITAKMKLEPTQRDIVIINTKQLEELKIPKNVPTSFKTARPRVPSQVENDRIQMQFVKSAAGFQRMLREIITQENSLSSKVDRTLDFAVKQDKISLKGSRGTPADVPNVVRGSRPLEPHSIAKRTLGDAFYSVDGIRGF